jgi:hypothetical protein
MGLSIRMTIGREGVPSLPCRRPLIFTEHWYFNPCEARLRYLAHTGHPFDLIHPQQSSQKTWRRAFLSSPSILGLSLSPTATMAISPTTIASCAKNRRQVPFGRFWRPNGVAIPGRRSSSTSFAFAHRSESQLLSGLCCWGSGARCRL